MLIVRSIFADKSQQQAPSMLNHLTQSFSNWWQQRPADTIDLNASEAGQNATTRLRPEMTEFMQTYIYPGGKHPDGTPLSPTERRSAAELTDIVTRLTTPDNHAANTAKPLKLHSWRQMATGLLYLLSGYHQTVAPTPTGIATGRAFHSQSQPANASANMHPPPNASPPHIKICHSPASRRSIKPRLPQSSLQTATIAPDKGRLAWEEYIENSFTVRYYMTDREGARLFRAAVRNTITYLESEAKVVLETLYASLDDPPPDKPRVVFTLTKMEGIATVYRSDGLIYMNLNTGYIKKFFALHGHDKLALEIRGVLLHELTHVYQLEPQSIAPGSDNRTRTAFIEGLADAVRISNELTARSATPGGHYLNGYIWAGFFFVWLRDHYDRAFIRKLNRSTQTITPWSFNAAIKHILGQQYDVDKLWQDYQGELHALHCQAVMASSAPARPIDNKSTT